MNLRYILIFGGFGVFLLWYGGTWAYRTQYKEPRTALATEIEQYDAEIKKWQDHNAMMSEFVKNNHLVYYPRSLPRTQARILYQYWLAEVAEFCDFENLNISSYNPENRPRIGTAYQFRIQAQVTAEGLAQFLYEFYWAAHLQRIIGMNVQPIENSERMLLTLQLEGVTLRSPPWPNYQYPLANRLPWQYHRRLSSTLFSSYQAAAENSLLQYARSGVDRADFTYLTMIQYENGEPILSLLDRSRSTTEPIFVKIGDTIKIGSFVATLLEVEEGNAVFLYGNQHWLLAPGECLNQAFALPPESR